MSQQPDVQLVRCSSCGATNRIPLDRMRAGQQPVCGRCKAVLQSGTSHPVVVTDASFSGDVASSPLPVLLDMWAPWCSPCRMFSPIVDQLAAELSGRVMVGKLNVDENPATVSSFGVRNIPTLLILRNGQEVDRITGAQPKAEILRVLENYI